MASTRKRVPENVAGDFFVDSSCIDCDTCRWMAPATFAAADDYAYVTRQPESAEATQRALMALLACPTGSIGTARKHDLAPAFGAFPDPIDGPVFHCGFHDESSFGAASYLIHREGGNLLVDVPRFARPLVKRLEDMGGVRWLFLTHKDDVGDHRKFREHFGCERILHRDDLGSSTRDVEHLLEGREPWSLDDQTLVLPTPGHTRGSACLVFRETYLFSGDHVAWSEPRQRIIAFRDACWFDWSRQRASMERLARLRFEWILPGHGRRCHFPAGRMATEMQRCVEWMGAAPSSAP